MATATTTPTHFGTLIAQNKESFVYLNKNDRRMRFNNSQDPIYFAFDYLESKSVSELAKEFVQDSIYEISTFISNIVK